MSRFEYYVQVTITIVIFIVISGIFVFSVDHLTKPKKTVAAVVEPPSAVEPTPAVAVTSNGNLAEMPLSGITSNGNGILPIPVTSNGN